MSQADQVFDRRLCTSFIVSSHIIPVGRTLPLGHEAANDHDGDGIPHVLVDVFVGDMIGMQDETADPTRQRAQKSDFALKETIVATYNHRVIIFIDDVLHRPRHAGPVGIADVRDDQSEHGDALSAQGPGESVGVVVQFLNGIQDPFAQFGTDVVGVIDHVGNGSNRYLGSLGNITYRGHKSPSRCTVAFNRLYNRLNA